jgi:transposase
MIAIYGQKMQESLRLYKPNYTQLQELISRHQDIKDMLEKENNRKEHFFDKSAKGSIDYIIKVLQKQLDSIEQEINKRINNTQELKQKAKVISCVKSVGQKTTMTLLAALPELGFANRRQIGPCSLFLIRAALVLNTLGLLWADLLSNAVCLCVLLLLLETTLL